jgi:hypothetical protein
MQPIHPTPAYPIPRPSKSNEAPVAFLQSPPNARPMHESQDSTGIARILGVWQEFQHEVQDNTADSNGQGPEDQLGLSWHDRSESTRHDSARKARQDPSDAS